LVTALLLIRYGELALKSPPVRREFETALRRNILDQFVREGLQVRLRSDHGHLYAETAEADAGLRLLRRVFGITSASAVHEVPSDRVEIGRRLLELARPRLTSEASFAVRVRRTGSHPFTSQDLARELGAAVLATCSDRNLSVDLEHPEVELFVEVRGPRTYLYFDRIAGPGGLPLGVAGRLVALVDGPRGALGTYLMMKRGCRVAIVTVPSGEPLVRDVLARFDPSAHVTSADPALEGWTKVVAGLAEEFHADGIVLPLDVDGYPDARTVWGDRVLFSPTVGLTEEEVSTRWKNAATLAA
jgi:adenylyl- and sulfurtransferase ThiI